MVQIFTKNSRRRTKICLQTLDVSVEELWGYIIEE